MTNAFTINPAAPRIDVRSLQTTANLRAGSAKGIDTRRAAVLADRHGGAYSRVMAASTPLPDCDGVGDCFFCAAGELARAAAGGQR